MILGIDFGGTSYQVFCVWRAGMILGHGDTLCKAWKKAKERLNNQKIGIQEVAPIKIYRPDAPYPRF